MEKNNGSPRSMNACASISFSLDMVDESNSKGREVQVAIARERSDVGVGDSQNLGLGGS